MDLNYSGVSINILVNIMQSLVSPIVEKIYMKIQYSSQSKSMVQSDTFTVQHIYLYALDMQRNIQ